ncbi:MAG: AtpZ/AtpI family protein [Desulfovibrio sp.]|nr:AtpZ/AtpI family protein [Desulfovibrio sp.]
MFKDILRQQQSGMESLAGPGVIGLHLVSGPLVGFCMGYGLDYWLDTGPWGKLAFLVIGIAAGFLNVYRDTRRLLKKMADRDARAKAGIENIGAGKDAGNHNTQS